MNYISNRGSFKKGQAPWNKGKKYGEETRRKISFVQLGKKLTAEHKLKLSKANKGKKYKPMSAQGRLNISLAHRGKRGPRSVETRSKLSEQRKGSKWTYTWKGGISKTNMLIRKSLEYRLWRESVMRRDNWKCIWCGSKKEIQADHIKRFSDYPELRFALDNGRTLCLACHKTTDTYGNRKNNTTNNK
jgi:5-methylcytosine-specific restriction endonuclease McrA